ALYRLDQIGDEIGPALQLYVDARPGFAHDLPRTHQGVVENDDIDCHEDRKSKEDRTGAEIHVSSLRASVRPGSSFFIWSTGRARQAFPSSGQVLRLLDPPFAADPDIG